jgi:xanthine dehydrogenase accessory factor
VLDLLTEILRRTDAGEPLAVCTVVSTRGSTPQDAGAVMLVLQDGSTLGTIGGGCVVAVVRTHALRILASAETQPTAALLDFHLNHDLGWDDGLICGGSMRVAVERLATSTSANHYRAALADLQAGNATTLTTTALAEDGQSHTFSRELLPTPRLIIAGAGHVALELARLARPIGFDVTVIDDRPDFASPERFPTATRIISPIDAALREAQINRHTYVTILTRGHRNDAAALAAVVNRPAAYIGVIGSKRKILAIFEDLLASGTTKPEALASVHAPIGLDLAAVTPAEIAVSIAAELIGTRRGGSLPANSMRLSPSQLKSLLDRKS